MFNRLLVILTISLLLPKYLLGSNQINKKASYEFDAALKSTRKEDLKRIVERALDPQSTPYKGLWIQLYELSKIDRSIQSKGLIIREGISRLSRSLSDLENNKNFSTKFNNYIQAYESVLEMRMRSPENIKSLQNFQKLLKDVDSGVFDSLEKERNFFQALRGLYLKNSFLASSLDKYFKARRQVRHSPEVLRVLYSLASSFKLESHILGISEGELTGALITLSHQPIQLGLELDEIKPDLVNNEIKARRMQKYKIFALSLIFPETGLSNLRREDRLPASEEIKN